MIRVKRSILLFVAVFGAGCEIRRNIEAPILHEEAPFEKIGGDPHCCGLYKFYDIPEQKVCYLFYTSNNHSSLSCAPVHADLQAERSAIYEGATPRRNSPEGE